MSEVHDYDIKYTRHQNSVVENKDVDMNITFTSPILSNPHEYQGAIRTVRFPITLVPFDHYTTTKWGVGLHAPNGLPETSVFAAVPYVATGGSDTGIYPEGTNPVVSYRQILAMINFGIEAAINKYSSNPFNAIPRIDFDPITEKFFIDIRYIDIQANRTVFVNSVLWKMLGFGFYGDIGEANSDFTDSMSDVTGIADDFAYRLINHNINQIQDPVDSAKRRIMQMFATSSTLSSVASFRLISHQCPFEGDTIISGLGNQDVKQNETKAVETKKVLAEFYPIWNGYKDYKDYAIYAPTVLKWMNMAQQTGWNKLHLRLEYVLDDGSSHVVLIPALSSVIVRLTIKSITHHPDSLVIPHPQQSLHRVITPYKRKIPLTVRR